MSSRTVIRSVLTEYGVTWAVNRTRYSCKLKLLKTMPSLEQWYETKADTAVKRLDIFGIDVAAIRGFLKALPEEKKAELIALANDACVGKIQGFSSLVLDYGYPVNWHLNPLTGKCCNTAVKWFKIPDFDEERGDIKVIWEASRFTHFYLLARVYLLTEDIKYYQAFNEQLNDWLGENPYSYGANYKCGQECALRLINGLMAYTVFFSCGVASERDKANIKELISRCYRKILSNFFYAYRCIKNNHTISELVGMIIGAWCCEDEKRVGKAYRILDQVIDKQFTADGGYTQFSFNYQRLALQDIECLLSISSKTGLQLSKQALERVLKSCLLLYQCQNDNGGMPNYGSNDGALIFPVTACGYRDYRPVINSIYVLITGSRLYDSGLYDEELLWFAGGVEKYPINNVQRMSSLFADAGLFTLRNEKSLAMLVLNNYKSRPAHMDQLHLDLWINGINVFCDSGTYSYASELSTELIATSGHNTVKVSDLEQMNKYGAFMLCGWTKRKHFEWQDDLLKGVMQSQNGYVHSRQVRAIENGYSIIDEVKVKTGHTIEVLYHTPCDIKLVNKELQLSCQDRPICTLFIDGGEVKIDKGQRSLYYLQSKPINIIRIQYKSQNTIKCTVSVKY